MRFVVDYGKQNQEALDASIALTTQKQRQPPSQIAVKVAGWAGIALGIVIVACASLAGRTLLAVAGLVLAGASFLCMQISTRHYVEAAREERIAQMDTVLVTGKHTYELDGEGMRVSTGRGPRVFRWADLAAWGIYSHYRFVRGKAGEFVLIDVAWLKDEQVTELEALFREHLGEALPAGSRA